MWISKEKYDGIVERINGMEIVLRQIESRSSILIENPADLAIPHSLGYTCFNKKYVSVASLLVKLLHRLDCVIEDVPAEVKISGRKR